MSDPANDDPIVAGEGGDGANAGIVAAHATRHAAPDALRRRIEATIRSQAAHSPTSRPLRRHFGLGFGLGALAGGAIAACVAIVVGLSMQVAMSSDDEIVDAHLRSMQAAHATDVVSSDRHTVKPWLSARLDFSPPVIDLAAQGFPLEGGRLDYVQQHPAAALVYRRQQHAIDVFAWPATGDSTRRNTSASTYSRRGINVVSWRADGMEFSAASDLAADELRTFADRLREAIAADRR